MENFGYLHVRHLFAKFHIHAMQWQSVFSIFWIKEEQKVKLAGEVTFRQSTTSSSSAGVSCGDPSNSHGGVFYTKMTSRWVG
jgi:hypothetical protein